VATCDVTRTVADARRVLEATGAAVVVLVDADGLAVGDLDADALEANADEVELLDVLRPVPSTVRPSVTVASVAASGGGERLVTTSDGRLLGRATVEGHDHDHESHDDDHDHDHDDGDPSIDLERYEEELAEVMQALQERFGDSEPSAEEVHGVLRDRLVAEGRSEEEADRFLQELGGEESGGDG